MLALALVLVVVGLVFLFVMPWVGIPLGLVGLLLLVLALTGFGKRATDRA